MKLVEIVTCLEWISLKTDLMETESTLFLGKGWNSSYSDNDIVVACQSLEYLPDLSSVKIDYPKA